MHGDTAVNKISDLIVFTLQWRERDKKQVSKQVSNVSGVTKHANGTWRDRSKCSFKQDEIEGLCTAA